MRKRVTRFAATRGEYMYLLLKGPALFTLALLLIFELIHHTIRTPVHFLFADLDSSTHGVILESRLDWVGGKSRVKVRDVKYSYVVNSLTYYSNMIDYTERTYLPEKQVNKYTKGSKVLVFYDSQFPWLSVLEKSSFNLGLIVSLGVAFIIFWVDVAWRVWVSGPKLISI